MDFQLISPLKIRCSGTSRKLITVEEYKEYQRDSRVNPIPWAVLDKLTDTEFGVSNVNYTKDSWNEIDGYIPKNIRESLFEFQKDNVYRMIHTKRCLNASSCGLGKSVQALATLGYFLSINKECMYPSVILCPSYLRSNWLAEISRWMPEYLDRVDVLRTSKECSIEHFTRCDQRVKVVSYDMFVKTVNGAAPNDRKNVKFSTVILDESHSIKNSKSKRYKGIEPYVKQAMQVFLLTATPAPNRPIELFTQLSLIAPRVFTDYFSFGKRYCKAKRDRYGKWDDRGSSKLDEMSLVMKTFCIRSRREDHITELPNVFRSQVLLDAKPCKALTSYKRASVKFDKLIEESKHRDVSFLLQSTVSEMFRLTCDVKVEPVIEYLETYCDANTLKEKVIIFCKHNVMLDAMKSFMDTRGDDYISINGTTPMDERTESVKTFLDTESSVTYALLTMGSCSTGINLIPIEHMIFTELDWNPSVIEQAMGRINRIGGASHLNYTFLLCDQTLDKKVMQKLQNKSSVNTAIIDGGCNYGDLEFEEVIEGDEQPSKRIKLK